MRNVAQYTYRLTSSNSITLTAGDHSLECVFQWPDEVQTQLDTLQRIIDGYAKSDPIIKEDGSYDRNYDYIDYYTSIPDYGSGMVEWWEEQTEVPQSLYKSDFPYTLLTQRKELCMELNAYLNDLQDMLVYQCIIKDETGYKSVMSVRPGAYCCWRDTAWSLRFTSNLEQIGKDDLDKTTVEVLIYEFI